MAPEIIERVFQPFVQSHSSPTHRFGGTGLRLAISRNYCHLLGGEISVTSSPGVGSIFTITLPRDTSGNPLKSLHSQVIAASNN